MKMKRPNNPSRLQLAVLLVAVFVFATNIVISVETTKKTEPNKKIKHHKHKQAKVIGNGDSSTVRSTVFNLLSFGAKGDGVSDDSKAVIEAWNVACRSVGEATVEIPSELKFLITPITLQGPCISQLVLQIDGSLLAPAKVSSWPESSLFQWINFKWIHNFTIQGSGKVDGQGSHWWTPSQTSHKKSKPTAIRFYASSNLTVRDIKIVNSPQCHLKFDSSSNVKVDNITIFSPENSPNTDGIHLQNTQNVEIHHSNIRCGDDCVSIQTGCSNVHVHHINCGPGHGISLGGLGKDKSVACVSNILIENITMQSTLYGVRIKTWQGGIGSVKNVTFSGIQVSDVSLPIMVDQYYCDNNVCKNQTGAVAIFGVKFDQIIGTYSSQPIHIACSNSIPCTNVNLINIQLKPSQKSFNRQALCWNSYGKSHSPVLAPSTIDHCLRSGGDSVVKRSIARSHDINVCQSRLP